MENGEKLPAVGICKTPYKAKQRSSHGVASTYGDPLNYVSKYAETITEKNPQERKELMRRMRTLDAAKKKNEEHHFWSQRQFFMEKAFDDQQELRFAKLKDKILNDFSDVNRHLINKYSSSVPAPLFSSEFSVSRRNSMDATVTEKIFPVNKGAINKGINYVKLYQKQKELDISRDARRDVSSTSRRSSLNTNLGMDGLNSRKASLVSEQIAYGLKSRKVSLVPEQESNNLKSRQASLVPEQETNGLKSRKTSIGTGYEINNPKSRRTSINTQNSQPEAKNMNPVLLPIGVLSKNLQNKKKNGNIMTGLTEDRLNGGKTQNGHVYFTELDPIQEAKFIIENMYDDKNLPDAVERAYDFVINEVQNGNRPEKSDEEIFQRRLEKLQQSVNPKKENLTSDDLLIKLTMSLPMSMLTKTDETLNDLSTALGYAKRNQRLLEREKTLGAQLGADDERFKKLQSALVTTTAGKVHQ